jgi:hypothetical protein
MPFTSTQGSGAVENLLSTCWPGRARPALYNCRRFCRLLRRGLRPHQSGHHHINPSRREPPAASQDSLSDEDEVRKRKDTLHHRIQCLKWNPLSGSLTTPAEGNTSQSAKTPRPQNCVIIWSLSNQPDSVIRLVAVVVWRPRRFPLVGIYAPHLS